MAGYPIAHHVNTKLALRLARRHVADNAATEASARLCLADAVKLEDRGDLPYAILRATDSLAYSVGVFHADYLRVRQMRDAVI